MKFRIIFIVAFGSIINIAAMQQNQNDTTLCDQLIFKELTSLPCKSDGRIDVITLANMFSAIKFTPDTFQHVKLQPKNKNLGICIVGTDSSNSKFQKPLVLKWYGKLSDSDFVRLKATYQKIFDLKQQSQLPSHLMQLKGLAYEKCSLENKWSVIGVMEKAHGIDLYALLRNHEFSFDYIKPILSAVGEAIAHLHQCTGLTNTGLATIHGDLHWPNIMVDGTKVKFIDIDDLYESLPPYKKKSIFYDFTDFIMRPIFRWHLIFRSEQEYNLYIMFMACVVKSYIQALNSTIRYPIAQLFKKFIATSIDALFDLITTSYNSIKILRSQHEAQWLLHRIDCDNTLQEFRTAFISSNISPDVLRAKLKALDSAIDQACNEVFTTPNAFDRSYAFTRTDDDDFIHLMTACCGQ